MNHEWSRSELICTVKVVVDLVEYLVAVVVVLGATSVVPGTTKSY